MSEKIQRLQRISQNILLAEEFMTRFGYDRDNANIRTDVLKVITFYQQQGLIKKELLFSQMNGIDFNFTTQILTLEEGTVLDQMQEAGYGLGEIRQGQYYAYHVSGAADSGDQRGIANSTLKSDSTLPGHEQDAFVYAVDKQLTKFYVTKSINVLLSTAKSVADTWSMWMDGAAISVTTSGGGVQLYVGKADNAQIKSEHQLAYEELVSKLESGLLIGEVSMGHREMLIKQIYILQSKGSFAYSRGLSELHSEAVCRLTELRDLLQSSFSSTVMLNDSKVYPIGSSMEDIIESSEQAINAIEPKQRLAA